MNPLVVRIASYVAARSPVELTTAGLGSCVAVALYDARTGAGGLAHAMLPLFEGGSRADDPKKYVDRLIGMLIEDVVALGARASGLTAKIVGGAAMFPGVCDSERRSIGERNVASAITVLEEIKVPVVGRDVGGYHGRSVCFKLISGELLVKSVRMGERRL